MASMKIVYILESEQGDHFYVGVTDNLTERLKMHNGGHVSHTSKHVPWRVRTFVAFDEPSRAFAFERYLKSGSGRAFAKKRL
jgi:predicted GIY-YIG superfamily endonuclease